MKKMKVLSLVMATAMAVSLFAGCSGSSTASDNAQSSASSQVSAAASESASSTSAVQFAGGSGTAEDPYQIQTADQLNAVRNDLKANYVLSADVDLSEYTNWEPIGKFEPLSEEENETPNPDVAFTGSFDGNGHKISNIKIENTEIYGCGLFGCVTGENSGVKNLTVENANVTGGMYSGCVIGSAFSGAVIEGITLSGENKLSGTFLIGGVVGASMCDLIKDCTASADVTLNGDNAQGVGIIVGGAEGSNLENCKAQNGTVTATGKASLSIGGMAGCAHESEYVKNCSAENVKVIAPEGSYMIGGLVGHAGRFNEEGKVDASISTLISDCTTKDVSITADESADRIGMIVGGGFYGQAYVQYYSEPSTFTVENCTAAGTIDGGKTIGTIAGYVYNNSTIKNCTADVTINGQAGTAEFGGDADSVALDKLN